MKGGQSSPDILLDLMLYTYCSHFKVNPAEAKQTPVHIIKDMLTVHAVFKELEAEEMKKAMKK